LLLPAPLAKSHRKGLSDLFTDKSAPGLTDLAHDDMSDSIKVNCTCAWHDVANVGAELQKHIQPEHMASSNFRPECACELRAHAN